MINVNDYIGREWAANGRGPKKYDCWGLVKAVYKDGMNVELPDWSVDPYSYSKAVKQLSTKVEHCIVERCAVYTPYPDTYDIAVLVKNKSCFHVGVVVGMGVLHIRGRGFTVTWERLSDFSRLYGGIMRCYRWQP